MQYKHKIPIHLEVEDHIIAGLSARQLLLIGAGLALGYLVWSGLSFLNTTSGGILCNVLLSLLPALLGVVAAFFRPASRGLEEWTIVWLVSLMQPGQYLWSPLPDEPERVLETHLLSVDPLIPEEEE